jgi:hypothetical protein
MDERRKAFEKWAREAKWEDGTMMFCPGMLRRIANRYISLRALVAYAAFCAGMERDR